MRPDPSKLDPLARNVLNWDVNAAAKALEEKYPDTWKRCSPKSIAAPEGYYSAKALAVGFTGAIEEAREQAYKQEFFDSNCAAVAGKAELHDFPLYYVSRPLINALLHSHPPKDMAWTDITLPFPALSFMLPRNVLKEPIEYGGSDLICINVCKFDVNEMLPIPTLPIQIQGREYARTCVSWFLAPSALIMQDSTFPSSHPLEPDATWIDANTDMVAKALKPDHYEGFTGPKGSFASMVAGLAANLILIMQARPEWIEQGTVVRKPSNKQPHAPVVRTPTWIGRNYQVIRRDAPSEPRAHFTELGWRAGHFKRVHFGAGRSESKTVFIDPYIAHTRGLQANEKVET